MIRRYALWTVALCTVALLGATGVSAERSSRPRLARSQPADGASEVQGGSVRAKARRAGVKAGAQERAPLPRPEEIEALLVFTQQHFPDVYARLDGARRDDARLFHQMIRRLFPPMKRLMKLAEVNPEDAERLIAIQKVEMRLRELRRRYTSAATEEERASLKVQMRQSIARRFELRQTRLRQENAALRRRLEEQTQRLTEQGEHKQQIIEDELTRLLAGGVKLKGARLAAGDPSSQPVGYVPNK